MQKYKKGMIKGIIMGDYIAVLKNVNQNNYLCNYIVIGMFINENKILFKNAS